MKKIDVMWVGLSAKNSKTGHKLPPLDTNSNSGRIINMIEARHKNLTFYRTNLVKYTPLDDRKKLRYPNSDEMNLAMPSLIREIKKYQPKIIFLLGRQVGKFTQDYLRQNNVAISATIQEIYHPSYIHVYKRNQLQEYLNEVSKKIESSTLPTDQPGRTGVVLHS